MLYRASRPLPPIDNTNSETFIVLNFEKKLAIVGNTEYAGEMKKSVFTLLNYLLPLEGVLSMHCSANVNPEDANDVALFFGLSGTGKTTLSADPTRRLIGDDEHGWSDNGVFNFEGGCYAKVIGLSESAEPEIYATTKRFGTILENVPFDPVTRLIDLDDDSITENTRASYPLEFIANAVPEKKAGHPKNIVLLTCDANGVMPPIARLSPNQALYQFISGYTSKIAGTEVGLREEPEITFSACFGGPFMVHHPYKYAELLKRKIERYGVKCWLVNTGWVGGPYGVGKRISIRHTRALLNAALTGKLDDVKYTKILSLGLKSQWNARMCLPKCFLPLLPGETRRSMTGAIRIWRCASRRISPSLQIVRRRKWWKRDRRCKLRYRLSRRYQLTLAVLRKCVKSDV